MGGGGRKLKTYVFRVVVEPDEDRWSAYCPVLEQYGAATWGYTKEEVLKHIQEVVEMIVEELIEEKELIPEEPPEVGLVSSQPRVSITL
jgi:predicted RNase H-like HicB family nuclease